MRRYWVTKWWIQSKDRDASISNYYFRKMKRKGTIISLVLISGLIFSANVSLAQEVGDVKEIVTIDRLSPDSPYDKIWQPFIAEWRSDYYIVAYGQALRGKTDMGNVVCSITKDGGKTWIQPITIFDHSIANGTRKYAYNNAVLFKPEGQNIIWCFAMRCPQYYSNSEDSELCAAYSVDGGQAWQQIELAMGFHSPLVTCAGIVTVKDGGVTRYLLPVHRNTLSGNMPGWPLRDPKGDREQFVLESTNLINWELAGYIPRPSGVWIHEGNIAEGDNPGELKIVHRTAQYEKAGISLEVPRAYSSISKDSGKTWSEAIEEPDLYNTAAKGFFGKDSKGRHIYVYNDGKMWVRKGLYYVVKEPGKNWSKPKLFYWDNNRNSYATLIEKEPGVFLCVWDSSDDPERTRTAIRFGVLDLNK